MNVFMLIPFAGYVGLWILASPLFLVYFKVFGIPVDLKNPVAMIRKVPAFLAIVTVPLCSFISFFIATKIILNEAATSLSAAQLLEVGIISLSCTIILDLLITVLGGKMDIRVYPVNLMYLLAWLVIIPSVVLAGH